ncbi:MAG TPA: amidohydrolase [Vicinamibacteria bacterium]|nr:amidohydrolase [Vicinamibacteria bacterium]
MKRTVLAAVLGLAAAAAAAAQNLEHDANPADLLLAGGQVATLAGPGLDARPLAVAVRGGRIVALGTEAELKPLLGPRTRRLDLAGALVLPGLTDAHVHVEGLGTARESLDLVGAATLAEALARVSAAARTLSAGEWLLGRGWDQNDWPGQKFPSAADLDRAAGDRPVFLVRVDGHAAWASTRALQAAGINAATADPDGGRILRDASGAPTGILIDTAQRLVSGRIPPPSREVRKRRLRAGLQAAAEGGLTAVHDAGVSLDTVPLYKELLAEGALPVRAYVMLRGPAEVLENADRLQPEIGLGDGRLTVRAIKVSADGALGSRGALLLEPYADEPSTRGLLTVDAAAYAKLLETALRRGFQVATHAIGDGGNRFVLDAYARAFGGRHGAAHRFRIEHAQVLAPADVPRFGALGVVPSMQPTHCTSDMYWAEARVGRERAQGAYLWKTFLRRDVAIAGGSDAPVESIAVLPGLHSAVTRQDAKGWPPGGWHPEERVTLREALDMFTHGAAFAAFEEKDRGSIEVGKRADFTVLTRDITALPAREILKTEVLLTIVGGEVAYKRP